MYIEVTNYNETIFNGLADDFLEENSYDGEIEEILCRLEDTPIGTSTIYFGNQFDEYVIEKIEDRVEEGEF